MAVRPWGGKEGARGVSAIGVQGKKSAAQRSFSNLKLHAPERASVGGKIEASWSRG